MEQGLAGEVAEDAARDGLLASEDRVLVAVSGGADSAATAALLAGARAHGLALHLVLGHVDHGWRGPREAALDLACVEALGALLRVPVVAAGPPERVVATEDAARRHRYRALSDLARRAGCGKVATGHHLRDQAETFVLRALRGSGPRGLAGIPRRRPLGPHLEVVRPVLFLDPERLRRLAIERALPHREDATNADTTRDRARVRARLVALGARSADAARTYAALADRFRRRLAASAATIEATLRDDLEVHPEACAVTLPAARLAALSPAAFDVALAHLGERIDADRDGPWRTRRHGALVRALARDPRGGAVDLPRGLRAERRGGRFLLVRVACPGPREASLPPGVARATIETAGGTGVVTREDVPREAFDLDAFAREVVTARDPASARAALDADVLGPAVTLRATRPDDAFTPLGRAAGGPVRVAAFLSREGVPATLRRGVRVAVGARGVAWVVGRRVDAAHAVTPATARVARLAFAVA